MQKSTTPGPGSAGPTTPPAPRVWAHLAISPRSQGRRHGGAARSIPKQPGSQQRLIIAIITRRTPAARAGQRGSQGGRAQYHPPSKVHQSEPCSYFEGISESVPPPRRTITLSLFRSRLTHPPVSLKINREEYFRRLSLPLSATTAAAALSHRPLSASSVSHPAYFFHSTLAPHRWLFSFFH